MRDVEVPYPKVGEWYRHPSGMLFEVVAIDEDDSTIDVQHFDGTVEEHDMDAWMDAGYELTDAPEDYSGSLDMEREDFATDRGEVHPEADYLGYADRAD
jgi:hypothetical protein